MPTYGTNSERRKCVHQNFIQLLIREYGLDVGIAFVHTSRQVPHTAFLRNIHFEITNTVM
jgi:hypothetical protein